MNKKNGFTLIEILVSVTILSIVSTVIASILFLSLRSDDKTRATKEVKQNGDAVISVIKQFVRSANSISCLSDQIETTNPNGESSLFSCNEGKIASNSADLTNNLVECSDFSVICSSVTGGQLVEISFSLAPTVNQLGDGAVEFSDKVYFREQ
jgi:prepilin-type N-terminal cleavage/methylation domain-containing protein